MVSAFYTALPWLCSLKQAVCVRARGCTKTAAGKITAAREECQCSTIPCGPPSVRLVTELTWLRSSSWCSSAIFAAAAAVLLLLLLLLVLLLERVWCTLRLFLLAVKLTMCG